jgi:formate hydrogenlyase subunit 4
MATTTAKPSNFLPATVTDDVIAALDTGSSFEGMGGARELQFAIISEGTLILLLAFLAMMTDSFQLSAMLNTASSADHAVAAPALALSAAALYIVMLAECCRVPVDDPETHLELTMIHEAMILDNSGPDLGIIHYAAALKLWIFASLLISLLFPATGLPGWILTLVSLGGVLICTLFVGITESIMARYRFLKVPQLLFGSFCFELAALAMLLISGGAK